MFKGKFIAKLTSNIVFLMSIVFVQSCTIGNDVNISNTIGLDVQVRIANLQSEEEYEEHESKTIKAALIKGEKEVVDTGRFSSIRRFDSPYHGEIDFDGIDHGYGVYILLIKVEGFQDYQEEIILTRERNAERVTIYAE